MQYKDAYEENWLGLYIAIIWYRQISAEEAMRIIQGTSNMKKMCRDISPEIVQRVRKVCRSANFFSMDRLSKRYGISRDTIMEILEGYYG